MSYIFTFLEQLPNSCLSTNLGTEEMIEGDLKNQQPAEKAICHLCICCHVPKTSMILLDSVLKSPRTPEYLLPLFPEWPRRRQSLGHPALTGPELTLSSKSQNPGALLLFF